MSIGATFSLGGNPSVTCQECGVKSYGDAVVDAFLSFWAHQADKHPGIHDG